MLLGGNIELINEELVKVYEKFTCTDLKQDDILKLRRNPFAELLINPNIIKVVKKDVQERMHSVIATW